MLIAPTAPGWIAWVALLVKPVPGRGTGEHHRADAALADAGWLAGLCDPSDGARLEMRYLHRPGDGLRCVLLGRVHGATREAAAVAAHRLRTRLGALPAHVRAEPVDDADEIQRLLDPFPPDPAGLAEVRKRIRAGRPIRPDAGVAYYLAVPRLAGGAASWEPLWQSVADLRHPFLLTVGLEPYTPAAEFIGLLGRLAAHYQRLSVPGQAPGSGLRQRGRELPADPFAGYAAGLFDDAWRRYHSGVFRVRITLAAPVPLPEPLVSRVAATICAPRDGQEGTHVVVTPEPGEHDIARRNVTTLDNTHWDRRYLAGLPDVPPALRRLAETMDAAEASAAWRLPVSSPGPAPKPALNILLACANPRGSEPLRLGEEDRTLRQSIALSAERDRIGVETLNAVTIDDLRRALLRRRFDVVHFSGHGTRKGLVFEDETGQLFRPSSTALADLFARRGIRVAVLNACYSLSAGRITAIGTEYTIAADGPLADPAAIEFTRGFYDALGAGLDIPDAYAEGRGAAELKGLTFTGILLRRGEEHTAP